MGDILGYFSRPRIDSEQQLRSAQRQAQTYTAEQEEQARKAGFRNADEMFLFQRQKEMESRVPARPSRLSLDSLLAWHPKNTISRASNALKEANTRR